MERCRTCQKCLASHVLPVSILLIHDTNLLTTVGYTMRKDTALECDSCLVVMDIKPAVYHLLCFYQDTKVVGVLAANAKILMNCKT